MSKPDSALDAIIKTTFSTDIQVNRLRKGFQYFNIKKYQNVWNMTMKTSLQ